MKLVPIHGQPSWHFASDRVEVAVTRTGGQMAPVRVRLPHRTVEPFSVAPWTEERSSKKLPPLLRALRGDFFCAPFGASSAPYRRESHPPHGEPANQEWQFRGFSTDETGAKKLDLLLQTKIRPGRIEKSIQLRPGETAIYCRHVLSGLRGKMSLGHHAMLKFPAAASSGQLSTSSIQFAQVLPVDFENPAQGGYSSLKPGAIFSRLDCVPMADGSLTDLSRYPARRGYEDLVQLVHEASPDFAWTAVTFPRERYVWFALKDPRVLRSTVLWLSNGGRHYPPWNGRHVDVMGLEDVTSYFHLGLAASAQTNPISQKGYATHIRLRAESPFVVNYIMAVAALPPNWVQVKTIERSAGGVVLHPNRGNAIRVPLDLDFLYSKNP